MKNERLDRIEALLNRLDAAVVVRDPGNARSAEAFDGLRKLMIQSGTSRRSHVAHLLSLADSIEREAPMELIRDRVNDFLLELGISRSTDVSCPEFFEVVEGEGDGFKCLVPAVVERLEDGRVNLVRHGKARRVPVAESILDEGSSEPAQNDEDSLAVDDLARLSTSPVDHRRTISLPIVIACSILTTAVGLIVGLIL